jgi:hypothetical protein
MQALQSHGECHAASTGLVRVLTRVLAELTGLSFRRLDVFGALCAALYIPCMNHACILDIFQDFVKIELVR